MPLNDLHGYQERIIPVFGSPLQASQHTLSNNLSSRLRHILINIGRSLLGRESKFCIFSAIQRNSVFRHFRVLMNSLISTSKTTQSGNKESIKISNDCLNVVFDILNALASDAIDDSYVSKGENVITLLSLSAIKQEALKSNAFSSYIFLSDAIVALEEASLSKTKLHQRIAVVRCI